MERLTKLFVVSWVFVALTVQVWLLSPGWDRLPIASAVIFVLAAAFAFRSRRTISVVLAFIYPAPVLIWLAAGGYTAPLMVLWMVALAGVLTPNLVSRSWQIASPWRGVLICWALIIVVGASITIARELDFDWSLIRVRGQAISNAATGGWPAYWITWILNDALIALLGILWFDWLFDISESDFQYMVVTPMVVSFGVTALAALYQLSVDVTALNPTGYGGTGRASGLLLDANVLGAIAALWIGMFVLYARHSERWFWPIAISGFAASWLVVWASGSRSALGAAVIVTTFDVVAAAARARNGLGRIPVVPVLFGFTIAVLVVAFAARSGVATGPVQRLRQATSPQVLHAEGGLVNALWTRDGFGTAAVTLIKDFPWFGVGVGSFPLLLADISTLPHDNAQNWFRHQLAELGFIGSLGWIAWFILFGYFVVKRRKGADPALWVARGALVAFVMMSLFGMPSQHVAVTITFWTAAYWFVTLVGASESKTVLGLTSWILILPVIVVFGIGTLNSARTTLRVAARAQRWGWPYSHGFYPVEVDDAGSRYQWTEKRAVAVVDAPTRWMQLTVRAGHPDVGARPVGMEVRRDGQVVLKGQLSSTAPITTFVSIPGDEPRARIETWVSRTFRPDHADDRDLGLRVSWRFVDTPHDSTSATR
jgi:hypothetical protein